MYWPVESRIQVGRDESEGDGEGDGSSLVVLVFESQCIFRFEVESELVSESQSDGSSAEYVVSPMWFARVPVDGSRIL